LAVFEVLCILKFFGVKLLVMALKIIEHGSPEYGQMVKLRDDILRKPLGLTFAPENPLASLSPRTNWNMKKKIS